MLSKTGKESRKMNTLRQRGQDSEEQINAMQQVLKLNVAVDQAEKGK